MTHDNAAAQKARVSDMKQRGVHANAASASIARSIVRRSLQCSGCARQQQKLRRQRPRKLYIPLPKQSSQSVRRPSLAVHLCVSDRSRASIEAIDPEARASH